MSDPVFIAEIEEHKVKAGETLDSLAKSAGMTWKELAEFNWGTSVPEEINRCLRDRVGCTKKTKDGKNYVFSNSDDPGILYIPKKWQRKSLPTDKKHVIRVRSRRSLTIRLEDEKGHAIPEADYKVVFETGDTRTGKLARNGAALLHGVPQCVYAVYYPDHDDILAKSLAAGLLDAFQAHDTAPIFCFLQHPPAVTKAAIAAYDKYFNEYTGKGLMEDIYQELTDDEALGLAEALMAHNGLTPRNPVQIGQRLELPWDEEGNANG